MHCSRRLARTLALAGTATALTVGAGSAMAYPLHEPASERPLPSPPRRYPVRRSAPVAATRPWPSSCRAPPLSWRPAERPLPAARAAGWPAHSLNASAQAPGRRSGGRSASDGSSAAATRAGWKADVA